MIKPLSAILAEVRGRQVKGWIQELKAAEAQAARQRGSAERTFQVNYRVGGRNSTDMGSSDERRGAVTDMLRALSPFEKHTSTSTWLVRLHIPQAETIARLLANPLDPDLDFLHVVEVTANRFSVGNANLES